MENIELAKAFLKGLLTNKRLKKKLPVSVIARIGKMNHGLTRRELREARKELGVVSEPIEGAQVWYLPGEPER